MGPKHKGKKKKKNAGHAASTAGDGGLTAASSAGDAALTAASSAGDAGSTSQEASAVKAGTPLQSRVDEVSKLDDEKQEQKGSGAVPDCPTGITLHERVERLESEIKDVKAEMKTIIIKNFEDLKTAEKTTLKNVEDLGAVIENLRSAMWDLTSAIVGLTPAVKALTTIMEAVEVDSNP